MRIDHRNPAQQGQTDPEFERELNGYMAELDQKIEAVRREGGRRPAFPPVRARQKETIPDSMGNTGKIFGANSDGPGLGKLAQHQMDNVVDGLNGNFKKDRKALLSFLAKCG